MGGDGDDVLIGGGGADHLVGGDGLDTASYVDSAQGLTFDLDGGTITGIGDGDTFDSVEKLRGSNVSDLFIAGAAAHSVDGGGGIDLISFDRSGIGLTIDMTNAAASTGLAAGDSFSAIKILSGSSLGDTIIGDSNATAFIAGLGGDTIDGGGGVDGAWYILSASGVSVNLATGANSAGDTLTNIEGLMGSQYDDTLIGDAGANLLEGAGGSDTIYGDRNSATGPIIVGATGAQADEE